MKKIQRTELKTFSKDNFRFPVSIQLNSISQVGDSNEQGSILRSFEGVAYTGKVIPNHGWFQNLYIDLSTVSALDRVPIFRDHDPSQIVGNGSFFMKEDGSVGVKGTIHSTEYGKEVERLSDEGFPWQMSVGVTAEFALDVPEGMSTEVNGQVAAGPSTIFKNSTLNEVSFVALGADFRTSAEVLDKKDNKEVQLLIKYMESEDMEPKKIENLEELNLKIESLTTELACACEQRDEIKSDADILRERNSDLEEQIKKLEDQIKASEFSEMAQAAGVELSKEKIEEFKATLSKEQFESVISMITEQAKKSKPDMPKEMFSAQVSEEQVEASQEVVDFDQETGHKDIGEKAAMLIAKKKAAGVSLSMIDAVKMVTKRD